MSDLTKFLKQHSDTDLIGGIIEAYSPEGEKIDIYLNAHNSIEDYFENKHRKECDFVGFEIIAELFDGSYYKAFDEIKEDIS